MSLEEGTVKTFFAIVLACGDTIDETEGQETEQLS
jgi:hypothetical protein